MKIYQVVSTDGYAPDDFIFGYFVSESKAEELRQERINWFTTVEGEYDLYDDLSWEDIIIVKVIETLD